MAESVCLAWSPSGRFLASGDYMGGVIVKKVRLKEDDKWAVFPVIETTLPEGWATDLVFSQDERFLLIATSIQDQV